MEKQRAILERLERIDGLRQEDAPAGVLLDEVRALLSEAEDWMREEIEGVLAGADAALLERLVTGSARHATRRIAEVADARELLAELGVEPLVLDREAQHGHDRADQRRILA